MMVAALDEFLKNGITPSAEDAMHQRRTIS